MYYEQYYTIASITQIFCNTYISMYTYRHIFKYTNIIHWLKKLEGQEKMYT